MAEKPDNNFKISLVCPKFENNFLGGGRGVEWFGDLTFLRIYTASPLGLSHFHLSSRILQSLQAGLLIHHHKTPARKIHLKCKSNWAIPPLKTLEPHFILSLQMSKSSNMPSSVPPPTPLANLT